MMLFLYVERLESTAGSVEKQPVQPETGRLPTLGSVLTCACIGLARVQLARPASFVLTHDAPTHRVHLFAALIGYSLYFNGGL